jgi:hypothetical protein
MQKLSMTVLMKCINGMLKQADWSQLVLLNSLTEWSHGEDDN